MAGRHGTRHFTYQYLGLHGQSRVSREDCPDERRSTEAGTIVSSVSVGSSGHGSYTWPISATGSHGSDYKVSVQSTSQPAIKDTSNELLHALVRNNDPLPTPTPSTITVTSPNGGETWERGTSHSHLGLHGQSRVSGEDCPVERRY